MHLRKIFLALFIFGLYSTQAQDEEFPAKEVRGAWVATVTNIDWPKSPADSVAVQKSSLEQLVDKLAAVNLNTIYFQVRPAGDALYKSDIEPWSRYLTGTQGLAPSPFWDPLQYVIDYAHGKNMEVHAWINPYRANLANTTVGLVPNHMALQFPQYAYPFSTFLWMDPGAEVVQNRTYNVVLDLVQRYDLDGIHMDDYFYPYPVTGLYFPDNSTYSQYIQTGGILSVDDWRRDNVNKLIKRLNDGIHETKSHVKFSVSPFGIYRACHPEGMPCSINGFDQYSGIYCDAKLWLQEGWLDVLQPQLYWKIDPPAQSYPVLLDWWTSQNIKERHIYAGNYLSRVLEGWPLTELTDQVKISRDPKYREKGSLGNIQFSAKIFDDDKFGAVAHFKETVYQFPALQPPFPWLSNENQTQGNLPGFKVETHKQDQTVTFTKSVQNGNENEAFNQIAIYQKIGGVWKLNQILGKPFEKSAVFQTQNLGNGHFAASRLNRVGLESEKIYFDL